MNIIVLQHIKIEDPGYIKDLMSANSRVRFMIDGKPYKFEVGKAYELNNQKWHSVMNKGKEDRINFIFDYVPPETLATLASQS